LIQFQNLGETVIVCTKIFGGKYLENAKDAPTFLNAGGNYPNAPLTIVIWAEAERVLKTNLKNIIQVNQFA